MKLLLTFLILHLYSNHADIFKMSIFDHYPSIYQANSAHELVETRFESDQCILQLEDGSQWKVHRIDNDKVLNWRIQDPVTITQNTRWFTNYKYIVINKATSTKVEVKLARNPLLNGPHSRQITTIDKDHKEVVLSDGTCWEISPLDASIFNDWEPGQTIIIGTNSNLSVFDLGKDGLLINANLDNHVRAIQK